MSTEHELDLGTDGDSPKGLSDTIIVPTLFLEWCVPELHTLSAFEVKAQ
jgi:hypothetical protein